MPFAKIENDIVVFKTYKNNSSLTQIPDNVCCGMIKNLDGSFSSPPVSSEEVMNRLREKRNKLLIQTDWRMVSDYPGTNQTEWQTYRQSLRDITTQTPSLDADGNLTGITWPTPPND